MTQTEDLRRPTVAAATLFPSLGILIASETVFAAVVPTLLTGRLGGGDLVAGLVVGTALGFGLLGVPLAVSSLQRGRARAVMSCCALVLAVAGPLCLTGARLPVAGILVAALAFGVTRAIATLVLLSDVGRLGPDSPGQGYNSAAQRFGSAVGGVVAGWVIAHEREDLGAVVLAAGAVVLLLSSAGRPGNVQAGSVSAAPTIAVLSHVTDLVRRDSRIQASLMLNVVVWICTFVGNTVVPVALLRSGVPRGEVGESVLLALVARDIVAVGIGALGWRLVRRFPVPVLVLGIGALTVLAAVTIVWGSFGLAVLLLAAVPSGIATALGISCANVVATAGASSSMELRLAASQALAGLPIAVLAVLLVWSVSALGPTGAMLTSSGLAMLIALIASGLSARDLSAANPRSQLPEGAADIATHS
jgi:hypothetical protein